MDIYLGIYNTDPSTEAETEPGGSRTASLLEFHIAIVFLHGQDVDKARFGSLLYAHALV